MFLTKLTLFLDSINRWAASIFQWLVFILTLVMFYDVIMRYIFNKPTIWSFDIEYMLGGSFFVLGIGYTLLKEKHVRVDVFYMHFKERTQAIIDIALYIIIFFPTFGLLLIKAIPWVITSWERGERTSESYWMPPIYPLKTILLIGIILLVIQGISELIKHIKKLKESLKNGGEKDELSQY